VKLCQATNSTTVNGDEFTTCLIADSSRHFFQHRRHQRHLNQLQQSCLPRLLEIVTSATRQAETINELTGALVWRHALRHQRS